MAPIALFSRKQYLVPLPGGRTLELGSRTLLMGIVNVTPDSFADGGLRLDPARAVADALVMEAEGADILDVGGESTRPGAEPLPAEEELARVIPVLDGLAGRTRVPVSVDTYKAAVARQALDRGVSIVNDISGLRYDPSLAGIVAERGAALVLTHHRGSSRVMYQDASYRALMSEVVDELGRQIEIATGAGVDRARIVVDPGIGFAKRAEHSFGLLAALDALAVLDRPVLVGPSRKSFLTAVLGDVPPGEREWGTAAAVAAAVMHGAHIVRVHGVREMTQVVRVADRIREASGLGA